MVIKGIVVEVPQQRSADSTARCTVRAVVVAYGITDTESNEAYGLAVVTPLAITQTQHDESAVLKVTVTLRVTGKMPIRLGKVKGMGSVMIIAVYTDQAGGTHEARRTVTFYTS